MTRKALSRMPFDRSELLPLPSQYKVSRALFIIQTGAIDCRHISNTAPCTMLAVVASHASAETVCMYAGTKPICSDHQESQCAAASQCAYRRIVWLCSCFTSPIRRARRFAELTWSGRDGPLIPMHTLKEAHLGWLQGMRQGVHADTPS